MQKTHDDMRQAYKRTSVQAAKKGHADGDFAKLG